MNHFRAFLRSGLAVLFVIFSSHIALGQASSLSGTVADPQGNAVVGASVTATLMATGVSRSVVTAKDGSYLFPQLAPGVYRLRAEGKGFASVVVEEVQVLVDTRQVVNLAFKQVGAVTETVTVQGGEAAINTSDATIGNNFSEAQIKALPLLANNVVNLLSLQPGAVYLPTGDIRSGSVSGSRSDQTNVTLDGVDVNDPQNSTAYTSVLRVTTESLQEFRVTTTNYGANQGRSSSAQVSLVTKRGNNDYHGAAYWSHRNTATSANEYFNKIRQLESGVPNKPPKLNWHIFGGSGSVPIIKDRWFIFANYEGFKQNSEATVSRAVPSTLMRNGYFQYRCATASQCPASTITVGGRSFSIPAGVRVLTPDEVKSLDPLGIGPNQAALAHFKLYPESNDPGRDGLNLVGYRFSAPIKDDTNVAIVRSDFNIDRDGKHTLFWRGILQDDTFRFSPQFPGQPPNSQLLLNPKGSSVGYDAVLKPTLTNSFRWGFTRISDQTAGLQQRTQVAFRFLDNLPATSSSSGRIVGTQNFVDDVTWVKGSHTVQAGANIRFTRIPSFNNGISFHNPVTNASWLLGVGRYTAPGHVRCTLPACTTLPAATSLAVWADGFTPLLGLITQVTGRYNYDKQGKVLPEGTSIKRRYATDEYEWYVQDQWKPFTNLTVTAGVRYSLLPPPWETNGLQVRPIPSFAEWIELRRSNMLRGLPANQAPRISFDLAGKANDRSGFYDTDYNNWAPRFSAAWSPAGRSGLAKRLFGENRTTVRGGYSLVYDRVGHGIATSFDTSGSFGLATSLSNPASQQTESTSPRFTGLYNVPTVDRTGRTLLQPAPPGGFPQTPPFGLEAITSSIDDGLTTPYSHLINFSIGREFARNFTVEASYVGRLGRDLLTRRDLAMPLNLVDPKSGVDYFTAASQLAKLIEAGTPVRSVAPIPYWENLFPTAGARGGNGLTSTQEMFLLFQDNAPDYSTALYIIDSFCFPVCVGATAANPDGNPYAFFSDQYFSLAGRSTIGFSNYHSLQLTTRKRFSAGMQFDFNYTLSKSLDLTSGVERGGGFGSIFTGGYTDFVINTWSPRLQYGQSDFDVRHQLNANWRVELPFGRGKMLAGSAPSYLNQIIGGWETTGIFRWTSGFPANIINCRSCWPTNWNLQGNAELKEGSSYPVTETNRSFKFPDGRVRPSIFPDPSVALKSLRFARPGETGFRNQLRGDGYFTLDLGLLKTFDIYESHKLKFRWEIFNLTNSVRFDTGSLSTFPDISSTFGQYTGTLTSARIMQFALRYEF
jgi:hypothetical protein